MPFTRCYYVFAVTLMLALPVAATVAGQQTNTSTNAVGSNGVGSQFEMVFWQSVISSEDIAQFDAYLAQYPSGTFAALARAKIAALGRKTAAVAPPPLTAAPPAPVVVSNTVAQPVGGKTAAAVAEAAPVAPTQSSAAQSGVIEVSLAEQLRALGQGQGLPPSGAAAAASLTVMPARPALIALVKPVLPNQFCSAVERNAYYDSDYKPAVDASDRQYRLVTDHMNKLRQANEDALQRRDLNLANLYAAEAKAYEPVAIEAFAARTAGDAEFRRLMAIPIVKCEGKS